MALQNFVDKVGPVVSAAWLNVVDVLKFTVFEDASTKVGARRALQTGGGQTAKELAAGITPTDYQYPPGDVRRYGATGDGVTDDTAALQAAVDAGELAYLPLGVYKTTSPITIDSTGRGIVGENSSYASTGSVIDYTGSDCAVKIYDAGSPAISNVRVENLGIVLRTASANGVEFSHATYSVFRNIHVRLMAATQAGFYGVGNGAGTAPYYDTFDECMVFGQNDNVTYPNQRGFWFQGGGGVTADGPNSCIISNCARISGVNVAFDFESSNGTMISNVGLEAITTYGFRIGKTATAAVGRADGNIVHGVRIEGNAACVFARFEGDADSNTITNYTPNSIDTVLFDNQASGYANLCKPQGIVYVASFYASDLPANTTTKLSPIATGNDGGVLVPFNSVPYAIHVTPHGVTGATAGTATIKVYRSGTLHTTLTYVVDATNRYADRVIQTTPDRSDAFNSFDGINGQVSVTVETSAAWDGLTVDLHVQVVFLG